MAYGYGWSEEQFNNSEIRILWMTWKGRNDERNRSGDWERLRILGTWVLSPHAKKGAKINPRELIRLPWDEDIEPKTKEDWLNEKKHLQPQWEKLIKAIENGRK